MKGYDLCLVDRKLQRLTEILDADNVSECTTCAFSCISEAYEYTEQLAINVTSGAEGVFAQLAAFFPTFWSNYSDVLLDW